jgi:hypothetical protein
MSKGRAAVAAPPRSSLYRLKPLAAPASVALSRASAIDGADAGPRRRGGPVPAERRDRSLHPRRIRFGLCAPARAASTPSRPWEVAVLTFQPSERRPVPELADVLLSSGEDAGTGPGARTPSPLSASSRAPGTCAPSAKTPRGTAAKMPARGRAEAPCPRQQSSSRSPPVRHLVRQFSRSEHRRVRAIPGAPTSCVPEQAYRRRTRAPRRHPRALRCSLLRSPPRADSGGRWAPPFVGGFGSHELLVVPSSTGSETSMTSRSSTRGRADASRCRGARSLGFTVLSWVVRRPHGRVPLALPRAPTANGACRRTLRGRTGAAASRQGAPSPRAAPTRSAPDHALLLPAGRVPRPAMTPAPGRAHAVRRHHRIV